MLHDTKALSVFLFSLSKTEHYVDTLKVPMLKGWHECCTGFLNVESCIPARYLITWVIPMTKVTDTNEICELIVLTYREQTMTQSQIRKKVQLYCRKLAVK